MLHAPPVDLITLTVCTNYEVLHYLTFCNIIHSIRILLVQWVINGQDCQRSNLSHNVQSLFIYCVLKGKTFFKYDLKPPVIVTCHLLYACVHSCIQFFLCQTEYCRVGGGIGWCAAVCGFVDFVSSFHFMIHNLYVCVRTCVCMHAHACVIQMHGMISLQTDQNMTPLQLQQPIW
jgi:hypothetical protein